MTALTPFPGIPKPKPRSIVYIDGFNLYYGAVRGTPYKWLNLQHLFHLLRPDDDLRLIRYFTALVTGNSLARQEAYLSALATQPLIEVIPGKFKTKQVVCNLTGCAFPGVRRFQVPEEKRTDVNIAVYMLDDAYQNVCDHFVLVSGDSDLVPAVRMIRNRFPEKQITVYVPSQNPVRSYAVELRSAANKSRDLPTNLLGRSQFDSQLPSGSGGFIVKPESW